MSLSNATPASLPPKRASAMIVAAAVMCLVPAIVTVAVVAPWRTSRGAVALNSTAAATLIVSVCVASLVLCWMVLRYSLVELGSKTVRQQRPFGSRVLHWTDVASVRVTATHVTLTARTGSRISFALGAFRDRAQVLAFVRDHVEHLRPS